VPAADSGTVPPPPGTGPSNPPPDIAELARRDPLTASRTYELLENGIEYNLAGIHIDAAQLVERLEQHKIWIDSSHRRGCRLQLRGADISAPDGYKIDLSGKEMREADLRHVKIGAANLADTDLRDASLTKVDFTSVEGLHPLMLAGADLKGAKLPEDVSWPEISRVEEISKNCGKYFIAVLSAGAYILLTLFGTTDANLIGDGASSKLPFLQIPVSIVSFYWVVPALLIAFGLFFWLNMQMLWENMSVLPAVMPTGANVDQATYPWIINSEARFNAKRLRFTLTTLDHITGWVATVLTMWFIPLVLWCVWDRCLPRHDVYLSGYQAAFTMIAIWLAFRFQLLKSATLRRKYKIVREIKNPLSSLGGTKRICLSLTISIVVAVFWILVTSAALIVPSHSTIWFQPLPKSTKRQLTARRLFYRLHLKYNADLERAQISIRPSGFKGVDETECRGVQGGSVQGRDIQNAYLQSAFMVNANLQHANLSNVDLEYADLRSIRAERYDGQLLLDLYPVFVAQICIQKNEKTTLPSVWRRAILRHTDMRWGQCSGVDFTGANLSHANLEGVNFAGAILTDTNFEGAILTGSHFNYSTCIGAYFFNTNLNKAIFTGADLRKVNLSWMKLNWANMDLTDLRETHLTGAYLNGAHLNGADLTGADLTGAHLNGADLTGADLTGAHLNGADLTGAYLNGAHLNGADLTEAYLNGAHLYGAHLTGKPINGAYVNEADFTGAHLAGAHLIGARISKWQIIVLKQDGADIRGVKVIH